MYPFDFDKYKNYTIEEFASDPHFREWVRNPSQSTYSLFWNAFLEAFPDKEAEVTGAQHLLIHLDNFFDRPKIPLKVLGSQFDALVSNVENTDRVPLSRKRNVVVHHLLKPGTKVLAMAACFLVLVIAFWFIQQPESLIRYNTSYGELTKIELSDGSEVFLNANTELRVDASWDEGEDRIVWLDGEAFFNVEKKPATAAKFTVITPDLAVQVLGTSFNVSSRRQQTEVVLTEGRVQLQIEEDEIEMFPGNLVTYSKQERRILQKVDVIDHSQYSWISGVLEIKQRPLSHIVAKLEDIYGVAVEVDPTIALDQAFTVRVPLDSLDLAIRILENTLNTQIHQRSDVLIINP